jgi:hypothetical protein
VSLSALNRNENVGRPNLAANASVNFAFSTCYLATNPVRRDDRETLLTGVALDPGDQLLELLPRRKFFLAYSHFYSMRNLNEERTYGC